MTQRKSQIIKAATLLFSKNGYDNTSIRELAKAVNLSVAGLYYFFQNKEEILFDILNHLLTKLLKSVRSTASDYVDAQTNITLIIEGIVKEVVDNKMEIVLLLKESRRLKPEQLVVIRNKERAVINLIKGEISRLDDENRLKNINLTSATFTLLAIINFTRYWFNPNGPLSTSEFVKETTEILFNGVLERDGESDWSAFMIKNSVKNKN